MELRGSVAIVTGASSGIGYATAKLLAQHGARLAIAARASDKLQSLARELVAQGCEVCVVPTDITQRSQVAALIATTQSRYGRVDIVVNNAGISTMCPIEKTPADILQKILDVNVFGTLNVIQEAIPVMRSQGGGLIVNISSMVSRQTWLSMGAYAATKHALNCLSETLRLEVAKDNIRVSMVFPGNTSTDFGKHALTHIDPRTAPPEGVAWTVDTPEYVAEKILLAIRTEPHEQYMR